MVAPLYVTLDCIGHGGINETVTVNCFDYYVSSSAGKCFLILLDADGNEIAKEITEHSAKRFQSAVTYANAKNYGIQSADFVVEF